MVNDILKYNSGKGKCLNKIGATAASLWQSVYFAIRSLPGSETRESTDHIFELYYFNSKIFATTLIYQPFFELVAPYCSLLRIEVSFGAWSLYAWPGHKRGWWLFPIWPLLYTFRCKKKLMTFFIMASTVYFQVLVSFQSIASTTVFMCSLAYKKEINLG